MEACENGRRLRWLLARQGHILLYADGVMEAACRGAMRAVAAQP